MAPSFVDSRPDGEVLFSCLSILQERTNKGENAKRKKRERDRQKERERERERERGRQVEGKTKTNAEI